MDSAFSKATAHSTPTTTQPPSPVSVSRQDSTLSTDTVNLVLNIPLGMELTANAISATHQAMDFAFPTVDPTRIITDNPAFATPTILLSQGLANFAIHTPPTPTPFTPVSATPAITDLGTNATPVTHLVQHAADLLTLNVSPAPQPQPLATDTAL
jgi:hypothetical protein